MLSSVCRQNRLHFFSQPPLMPFSLRSFLAWPILSATLFSFFPLSVERGPSFPLLPPFLLFIHFSFSRCVFLCYPPWKERLLSACKTMVFFLVHPPSNQTPSAVLCLFSSLPAILSPFADLSYGRTLSRFTPGGAPQSGQPSLSPPSRFPTSFPSFRVA